MTTAPQPNHEDIYARIGRMSEALYNLGLRVTDGGALFNSGIYIPHKQILGPITYSVLDTDLSLLGNTGGGNITLNLPQIVAPFGRLLIIKRITSAAGSITITPFAGDGIFTTNSASPLASLGVISGGFVVVLISVTTGVWGTLYRGNG